MSSGSSSSSGNIGVSKCLVCFAWEVLYPPATVSRTGTLGNNGAHPDGVRMQDMFRWQQGALLMPLP
jgi:hypothetical protein